MKLHIYIVIALILFSSLVGAVELKEDIVDKYTSFSNHIEEGVVYDENGALKYEYKIVNTDNVFLFRIKEKVAFLPASIVEIFHCEQGCFGKEHHVIFRTSLPASIFHSVYGPYGNSAVIPVVLRFEDLNRPFSVKDINISEAVKSRDNEANLSHFVFGDYRLLLDARQIIEMKNKNVNVNIKHGSYNGEFDDEIEEYQTVAANLAVLRNLCNRTGELSKDYISGELLNMRIDETVSLESVLLGAQIYAQISDYSNAIKYYSRGLDYNARVVSGCRPELILKNRANVYLNMKKYDLARKDLKICFERDSNDLYVLNTLAWIAYVDDNASVKEVANALKLAEKACELSHWKNEDIVDTYSKLKEKITVKNLQAFEADKGVTH